MVMSSTMITVVGMWQGVGVAGFATKAPETLTRRPEAVSPTWSTTVRGHGQRCDHLRLPSAVAKFATAAATATRLHVAYVLGADVATRSGRTRGQAPRSRSLQLEHHGIGQASRPRGRASAS